MGTRHWPEDANEAMEKLRSERDELRAEVERLRDLLDKPIVEAAFKAVRDGQVELLDLDTLEPVDD